MRSADAFERSLKRSLDQYEVPYNSADWAKLERALDEQRGQAWHASAGLYALLLGGTLAVASTLYMMLSEPFQPNDQPVSATVAELLTGPTAEQEPQQEMLAASPARGPEHAEEVSSAATTKVQPTDAPSSRPSAGTSTHTTSETKENAPVPAVSSTEPSVPEAPKPTGTEMAIRVSSTEGCPGTKVDFGLDNASEDGIYLWNFGDGSFSNKARPTHTFTKSGAYEVMLSHSAVGGGSIMNRPVSDRIVIHEAPEASFSYLERNYPGAVPSIHFENRSVGGKTYLWDLGDGTTSNAVHPDHVYKKQGTYSVILTVTNGKGCVDRSEQTVHIEKNYDLQAAKTFSPNGDGVDDTFLPEALKQLGDPFKMTIFDRTTGQVIFETSDTKRPWNGRIGNKAQLCEAGDYVWVVETTEKNGGTYDGVIRLLP